MTTSQGLTRCVSWRRVCVTKQYNGTSTGPPLSRFLSTVRISSASNAFGWSKLYSDTLAFSSSVRPL
eukprot:1188846-Prorocentrum_minimum.AAC.4